MFETNGFPFAPDWKKMGWANIICHKASLIWMDQTKRGIFWVAEAKFLFLTLLLQPVLADASGFMATRRPSV